MLPTSRRAFSLIELTVASAILLIVGTLGALLLKRSLQAATRGSLQAEMQQQATVSLQSLLVDLRRSTPAGVSIRSSDAPRAIAVCPLDPADPSQGSAGPVQPDGTLVWSSGFIIYHYDAGASSLRRREWPGGSVVATSEETNIAYPRKLSPDRLAEVLAGTSPRERILCRGVTGFHVDYPPGGSDRTFVQPMRIRLEQERRGYTGRPNTEKFSYTRSLFIPDQL